MRVLSIKQPYTELILQGKKKIELIGWNTKFRGKFLIHSSKFNRDKKLHLADSCLEKYGFILEDIQRIKLIPAKDNLGFGILI